MNTHFPADQDSYQALIPLGQSDINKFVVANKLGQALVLDPVPSMRADEDGMINYLSHSYVKFTGKNLTNSMKSKILESQLWFNQNTVIWAYFEANVNELRELLVSYFCPSDELIRDELGRFSLAMLSILSYEDYIVKWMDHFGILPDVTLMKSLSQKDTLRRKVDFYLSRDLPSWGRLKGLISYLENPIDLNFKFRDSLKKNINSSSKPIGQSTHNTINLHLEILSDCSFSCPGCYVKRSNFLHDGWWRELEFSIKNIPFTEWNELVIGPVDIFSASNFDKVLSREIWDQFLGHKFSAITFNSTMNSDDSEILRRVQRIKEVFRGKKLEFFVIVDINKFLSESPDYINYLKSKIALLGDSNIIFTANNPDVFYWRFEAPGEISYRYFQKNFKYTPSFFRSRQKSIIHERLEAWNACSREHENILSYTHDPYFGSSTYTTLVYKEGKLYFSPCVVDFVFLQISSLEIQSPADIDRIRSHRPEGECINCELRSSCSSKGVFAVKDFLQRQDCVLPRNIRESQKNN
jgi:hypothetical protein